MTHLKLRLDGSSTEVLREGLNVKKSLPSNTELRDIPETLCSSELSRSSNLSNENAFTKRLNVISIADKVSKESCRQVEVVKNEVCGFKLEKPKMPKFGGNVREYAIFRVDFKHAIESRYSKLDTITFLCTCQQGKPQTAGSNQRNRVGLRCCMGVVRRDLW